MIPSNEPTITTIPPSNSPTFNPSADSGVYTTSNENMNLVWALIGALSGVLLLGCIIGLICYRYVKKLTNEIDKASIVMNKNNDLKGVEIKEQQPREGHFTEEGMHYDDNDVDRIDLNEGDVQNDENIITEGEHEQEVHNDHNNDNVEEKEKGSYNSSMDFYENWAIKKETSFRGLPKEPQTDGNQ